ncbi:MAG: GntR family transcriptional regulator [Proteobacteria bacterium]|nr:GntR family transcriptional regulator [Pseudomonadota bacterium]
MRKMQSSLKLSSNGTLLHRQLYVLLKEQIVTGRYHSGDRLPTQDELCRQFSISRITVRRALGDLQDEGLIRNEQGVGAFVTADIERLSRGPDFSFIGDMRRTLKETTMQLLLLQAQRCPPAIAATLGLPEGAEALHVVRTRSKDGKPVALMDGWIPPPYAANVTAKGLKRKSLHELIAGGFDKLGRVAQEVNAALADPIVADGLQVELNSAVLRTTRLVHHRDGAPVHYVTVWTTPLRTRLVLEIEAEEIGGHNVGRLLHDVRE